jgi:hypothetical protein
MAGGEDNLCIFNLYCLVRGSGAGKINFAASALQTKALACAEALHASAEWEMGTIHEETDSVVLVKVLQSTDYDLAPEGVLFRDMRIFMRLNFNSYPKSRMCLELVIM